MTSGNSQLNNAIAQVSDELMGEFLANGSKSRLKVEILMRISQEEKNMVASRIISYIQMNRKLRGVDVRWRSNKLKGRDDLNFAIESNNGDMASHLLNLRLI